MRRGRSILQGLSFNRKSSFLLKLICNTRFVKRELKLEQDVVSLDILTEVDVLGDGDQEEEEDVNDDEDVNDEDDGESDEEDMDEGEEIEEVEDIEMDKEANAWVGNENELLHIKFNSNEEADDEEEEEKEEDMKDVKLKVEEEDVRLSIPIEDGEAACKGEV